MRVPILREFSSSHLFWFELLLHASPNNFLLFLFRSSRSHGCLSHTHPMPAKPHLCIQCVCVCLGECARASRSQLTLKLCAGKIITIKNEFHTRQRTNADAAPSTKHKTKIDGKNVNFSSTCLRRFRKVMWQPPSGENTRKTNWKQKKRNSLRTILI